MKRFISFTTLVLASLGLALLPSSSSVLAQSGQALEIGPPVISLSGNPGETVTTLISLRDVSPSPLIVTSELNDFVANGEDGTPRVLVDGETTPYSIKEWVRPIPVLNLQPREIVSQEVVIDIPSNAAPGGYYGIIRFTGTPPELEGTGVALNASLGSLIFLKVNGQANESLTIEDLTVTSGGVTNTIVEGIPITVSSRVKNTGNTFERPVGLITIKDLFGNVVATLPVNQEQRTILSDSTRKFDQQLDNTVVGDRFLFGGYTAEIVIDYGSDGKQVKESLTFWVIPYRMIAAIVIGLIVGFFILRFVIRRYNQSVVAKATGVKPAKKQKRRKKS